MLSFYAIILQLPYHVSLIRFIEFSSNILLLDNWFCIMSIYIEAPMWNHTNFLQNSNKFPRLQQRVHKNLLVEMVELQSHEKGLTSFPTSQPWVDTPIKTFLTWASLWAHVFNFKVNFLSLKRGYCGWNSNNVFKYLIYKYWF